MTAATQTVTKMGFQTEVRQLLKLMIHSLYSNKEIFLRELVSNASDACDKLRFEALKNDGLYDGDSSLRIHITFDEAAKTLTISDNGIGMSRQEVIDNIGTIARSGTKQFLEALTGDQAKDANLIGQFGVGFYSAFIVADKVTLATRRAGATVSEGVQWESDGEGEYTLESVEKAERGTSIVLHLKEDAAEFLNGWRLRNLVRKYSNHITLPIEMQKEGEKQDGENAVEWETVNQATALWARAKNEIAKEEYDEFYKQTFHDFEAPLTCSHNRVEGKQEYTSLLYIPKRAPFDLWDRDGKRGLKLYVKRVFLMDDTEQLLPNYLRFVRGVIDSADLPLNVSREILQSSKDIDAIRGATTKRVLGLLEDLAENDKDHYAAFWSTFGNVLKEGVVEDFANKERIAGLLRFASTHGDGEAAQTVSLADYGTRMKEGQKAIYYLTADSHTAAKSSPHLEYFRKKGIEVLLLSDRVDEWVTSHLSEFDGKELVSVARSDLDLDDLATEEEKAEEKKAQDAHADLLKKIKDALGDKVKDVRATTRLSASASCLAVESGDMSLHMERLLKAAGQSVPGRKPVLEINTSHPLVLKLKNEQVESRVSDWSHVLFDQALLSEGGQLDDPAAFVSRLNGLLMML